ncbi:MAG: glycosyltransferase [Planctomycetota bacterium]
MARFLLAGGGTGGHLVPGLSLARSLAARGAELHLVRSGRAVENDFLKELDSLDPRMAVHEIPWHGRGVLLPFLLARSLVPAHRLIRSVKPDVVVGLGGGGGLTCLVAAWRRGIPFVLLEQNVVPGKANRLMARFARRVYTAFPDTVKAFAGRSAVWSGMPLRPGLGRPAEAARSAAALGRRLGFDPSKTLLLVLGGSQGARALNEAVPGLVASLPDELKEGVAVVHISGRGNERSTARAWGEASTEAHILPFCVEMEALYSAADLVLCRGGGTTLHELAAAGRPSIIVPYPWHRDRHQYANAEWFEERGASRVLEQDQLTGGGGLCLLIELLSDASARRRMGASARRSLPLDAGTRISAELESLASGGKQTSEEPHSRGRTRRQEEAGAR